MESVTARVGERFLQYPIVRQFALRDRLVNSCQILINNPAGSQVKMANFRVAHLSIRQADVGPACAQFRVWIIAVEFVVKWCPREERCISIFFALLLATGIDAPAVANNEHNRANHRKRTLPTIEKIDKRFFR